MIQTATKPAPAKAAPHGHTTAPDRFAYAPILVIALFFAALTLVISPVGNFPLNDDWMYSNAVEQFLQHGRFTFVGYNCTSCLLHVLAGAGVCKIFGFSHTALRSLTLVFAFVNTLVMYWFAREFRLDKKVSTFLALAFACNPIYINLAFSFMTDIPSLCLSTASLLLTVQGLRRSSPLRLNLAGILLLGAIAVRQTNAALVALNACALGYLWLRRRHSWSLLISLVVLPVIWFKLVAIIAPINVGHHSGDAYDWYQNQMGGLLKTLLRTPVIGLYSLTPRIGEAAFYSALLLSPALVSFAVCFRDLVQGKVRIAGVWFVAAAAIVVTTMMKMVVVDQSYMPFSQNILRIPVIGSLGIMGINLPRLSDKQSLPLTQLTAVAAILLLTLWAAVLQRVCLRLYRAWKDKSGSVQAQRNDARALSEFIVAASATGLLILVTAQASISDLDRYYVIPSASLVIMLAIFQRWLRVKTQWLVAGPLLVAMATYSICAQQDYMSWNRARWAAAHWLESQNISPAQIDAGAEYDFEQNKLLYRSRYRGNAPQNKWRWWSINGEQYLVSFSPVPGYYQIATQSYFSALTMHKRQLLILKRQ